MKQIDKVRQRYAVARLTVTVKVFQRCKGFELIARRTAGVLQLIMALQRHMVRCKYEIIVLVMDCLAILVRLDRSGQVIECAPVFFALRDRDRIGSILYCNFLCHRQDFPALGCNRTVLVHYIPLGHSKGDLVSCFVIGRSDLQLILVCQTFPCFLAVVYGVPFHCKAGNIRLCACGRPWRHTVSAEQLQGCLGIYSCKGVLVRLRCIQLDLG